MGTGQAQAPYCAYHGGLWALKSDLMRGSTTVTPKISGLPKAHSRQFATPLHLLDKVRETPVHACGASFSFLLPLSSGMPNPAKQTIWPRLPEAVGQSATLFAVPATASRGLDDKLQPRV